MAINLLARLGLDSSGFATGLAKAQVTATKAGAQIGSAMRNQFMAFFGTAAIGAAIKNVIDYGGKINDLSNRTFLSKKALQEFDYIAQQTGTTLDTFVRSEQFLARAQTAAIQGSKEMVEIFSRFGLSVSDLQRLDAHQLFLLLSDAIGKTALSSRQVDEVLKLMGRSAGELIPAMKEGFDGMIDRAHKLGLILSDEVITKLDEAGDRLNEAKLRARPLAADAAMFGVETAENASTVLKAIAAGRSASAAAGTWNLSPMPFLRAFGQSVDQSNQQIMDSYGSKSLVAEFEKQRRLLEQIERNTKSQGEGVPNVF